MKTRTAFPLFYALSFLMVSVGNGSAQLNPPYPYNVAIIFDSARITHDLNQGKITPDTIRGSMQDNSHLGSFKMTINIKTGTQWVTTTKIGGNVVYDGNIIEIAQSQILPIEIIISPNANRSDTESYCLTLSLSPTYIISTQCITLAVTNTEAAVSTDLLAPDLTIVPNPAGSYIFARGLSAEKAEYRYEIFSISGAEVRHGMLQADARINVQNLPSGAYRLLLFDGKRTHTNTAFTVLH